MPLFGLIHDSPLIYAGQRLARQARSRSSVWNPKGVGAGATSVSRIGFSNMRIVFRRPQLDYYLNNTKGPVGRYMFERGLRIMMAAKGQVGVKTGALKASINMTQYRVPMGQNVKIGSPLSYALLHHEGTKPHIITPDRAEVLRFSSRGRVVYTRIVRHPGTKPNKYLADNLYLIR